MQPSRPPILAATSQLTNLTVPAIYLASKDGYEDSVLPTGDLAGAPEDALDTACGLYLGDPTAWT
jgi:hypothetical protein